MMRHARLLFWIVIGLSGALTCLALAWFGRQLPLAGTLATGIGTAALQSRIDAIEEKAILRQALTPDEKAFLRGLYQTFAHGAQLTFVTRQSADMMERYLSRSGEDLHTAPRIFVGSRPVKRSMNWLRQQARVVLQKQDRVELRTPTFYMGDPEFFDAFVGLYFGTLSLRGTREHDGSLVLHWRAEVPWKWPSYAEIYARYGEYHAQSFPLPNARSLLLGSEHCLMLDDGLGGYLADVGMARPFLVYSEWEERP